MTRLAGIGAVKFSSRIAQRGSQNPSAELVSPQGFGLWRDREECLTAAVPVRQPCSPCGGLTRESVESSRNLPRPLRPEQGKRRPSGAADRIGGATVERGSIDLSSNRCCEDPLSRRSPKRPEASESSVCARQKGCRRSLGRPPASLGREGRPAYPNRPKRKLFASSAFSLTPSLSRSIDGSESGLSDKGSSGASSIPRIGTSGGSDRSMASSILS